MEGTTLNRRHQLRLLVAAGHFGFITAKRQQAWGKRGRAEDLRRPRES